MHKRIDVKEDLVNANEELKGALYAQVIIKQFLLFNMY